jgi:hypothetical protein
MQTQIIARANEKGISFPDGTIMLSRQGCSTTVNCNANGAFMEIHLGARARFHLFYESNGAGMQHSRDGSFQLSRSEHFLDDRFIDDALDFVEHHTGTRPAAIRKGIHAYMFGMGSYAYEKGDIILSPFRYRGEDRSVVFTTGAIVATPAEDFPIKPKQFTTTGILVLSDDNQVRFALSEALKHGFHACDTKLGFDHCMRRLAWLAGTYYLATRAGQVVDVHILKNDMESPASTTAG